MLEEDREGVGRVNGDVICAGEFEGRFWRVAGRDSG